MILNQKKLQNLREKILLTQISGSMMMQIKKVIRNLHPKYKKGKEAIKLMLMLRMMKKELWLLKKKERKRRLLLVMLKLREIEMLNIKRNKTRKSKSKAKRKPHLVMKERTIRMKWMRTMNSMILGEVLV